MPAEWLDFYVLATITLQKGFTRRQVLLDHESNDVHAYMIDWYHIGEHFKCHRIREI